MDKYGLVLEGGGMRGAYTAGALSWFIDHNIMFDYGVGISAGAIHLCSYLLKDKDLLYNISVEYTANPNNVGIKPLLREGRLVGYEYMFYDVLVKTLHYDIKTVNQNDQYEIGLYDLKQQAPVFIKTSTLDQECKLLKASCTLPIAGKIVEYNDHLYLDAGIKVMIPFEQSLVNGCNKQFVIVTKPEGYIRKAAGFFARLLIKFNYLKYPQIFKDYCVRHINYQKQMDMVLDAVEKKEAFLIRPSKKIKVNRFSGDYESLKELYHLGYQDMEAQKDAILAFLKK
ncbi:patatin family protein [Erysipelotrichaceae bacterium OH741_COT-311]|nr:patatin family protein [Erysipelotrichaceae bacterium OH741_COT-311]